MEALKQREYPKMLERLQPTVAAAKLNERVKKISKINSEIADWLQERRKIELIYATNLRKLANRSVLRIKDQMGVFDEPWAQIMTATEEIAKSHSHLSQCIERDIEKPLREFSTTNTEMSNINSMQENISTIAKELEDAQAKSERLAKKGGKATANRIDAAASKLQSAGQQWDVQAAFIFESLQALDERRLNYLRDILTQYQTHEVDHIERTRKSTERTLKCMIEINTAEEIVNWSQAVIAENPVVRPILVPETDNPIPPTTTGSSNLGDDQSEHSQPSKSECGEKKKFQRIGTMFIRRRQTVHHAFRPGSEASENGLKSHTRGSSSRSDNPISSPKASSNNFKEPDARLSSLKESLEPNLSSDNVDENKDAHSILDLPLRKSSMLSPSVTTIAGLTATVDGDALPRPSSTSWHPNTKEKLDNECFSTPPAANDPISQAQQDSAQTDQPHFKLNIQKEPIVEQESDAKAALSSVANTLRSAQVKKTSAFRGRRETRNTMQMSIGDLSGLDREIPLPISSGPASPTTVSNKTMPPSTNASSQNTANFGSENASIKSEHSWIMQPSLNPEKKLSGLICSIIETVSASFKQESLMSIEITGEIALSYIPDTGDSSSKSQNSETLKIENISNLEIELPDKSLTQPVLENSVNQYTINLEPISSKYAVAFTYHLSDLEAVSTPAPLLIKSLWKNQGDKIGLILEYSLNPNYSSIPITFNNLILVAHYSGTSATSCQTKPSGIHIKHKSLVYWRLGSVKLDKTWIKVIARLTGTENGVPEPGHTEAKWDFCNTNNTGPISISGISVMKRVIESIDDKEEPIDKAPIERRSKEGDEEYDPFSDERATASPTTDSVEDNNWKEITTLKKLVSGNYSFKQ